MSQKPPPPMFSRMESLRFGATPRMLRALLALLFVVLVPTGANMLLKPASPQAAAPLVVQGWTTADAGGLAMRLLQGGLPAPDQRQKNVPCKETLGQFMINGACWQRLPVPPPCPISDGAFEHDDHRCYVRVLRAERVKQSGDVYPVSVAGEE